MTIVWGIELRETEAVRQGHAIAVWEDGSIRSCTFTGDPKPLVELIKQQPTKFLLNLPRPPTRPTAILCHPKTKASYVAWIKDREERTKNIGLGPCDIEGCDKLENGKGRIPLCDEHYNKFEAFKAGEGR